MKTEYKVLIGVAVALALIFIGFAVHHHNKKKHHGDKPAGGTPSAENPGPQSTPSTANPTPAGAGGAPTAASIPV